MPGKSTEHTMKVTTLRFGLDLWRLLKREADAAGISVSQYVREAALARAASSAGARGQVPFALIASASREVAEGPDVPVDHRLAIERALANLARALAKEQRADASALHAEARQASKRAAQLQRQAAKHAARS